MEHRIHQQFLSRLQPLADHITATELTAFQMAPTSDCYGCWLQVDRNGGIRSTFCGCPDHLYRGGNRDGCKHQQAGNRARIGSLSLQEMRAELCKYEFHRSHGQNKFQPDEIVQVLVDRASQASPAAIALNWQSGLAGGVGAGHGGAAAHSQTTGGVGAGRGGTATCSQTMGGVGAGRGSTGGVGTGHGGAAARSQTTGGVGTGRGGTVACSQTTGGVGTGRGSAAACSQTTGRKWLDVSESAALLRAAAVGRRSGPLKNLTRKARHAYRGKRQRGGGQACQLRVNASRKSRDSPISRAIRTQQQQQKKQKT